MNIDLVPEHVDQRRSLRKPLRTVGSLSIADDVFEFKSVDIGFGGICIVTAEQLHLGQRCRVDINLLVQGKRLEVSAIAKINYCMCGRDGFRSGLQFVQMLSKASAVAIAQFMQS